MSKTIIVNIKLEGFDYYVGKSTEYGIGRIIRNANDDPAIANDIIAGDKQKKLTEYKRKLEEKIAADAQFAGRVKELSGKRLGCMCASQAGLPVDGNPLTAHCHAQILGAIADKLESETND